MRAVQTILNIAAYRFVTLNDAADWRESIRSQGEKLQLKGTVLLAGEGINLVVAGAEAAVREFMAWLRRDRRFAELEFKESRSESVPFKRWNVKLKAEIIRMNHPAIQPQAQRAPAVDAATLSRWLEAGHDDAGRPVVTLDTRNAFEVDHGRFQGAIDWRIAKFSEFPQALLAHREALQNNVYQLDGGILKYFEETGGTHFDGSCFVFDEREALGPNLAPAAA
jgi:UPF0176 protein